MPTRVLRIRAFAVLLCGAALAASHPRPLLAQSQPESHMSTDIDAQSGFRLPLLKREELTDDAARKTYDSAMTPGETIVGLRGPAGVQLYSPKTTQHLRAINRYLRYESGIPPRIREIAILTTAREMDSQFEWVAHEPEALKVGVPQNVIDTIKFRKSTAGLDDTDATVIELGRQIWRDHKVKSETFAKLKGTFGPHKLIDLVLLMGNYAGTAAMLTAVDMQLHPDKKPLLPIP